MGNLEKGLKNDKGKLQWSLVPWNEMKEVVKVLQHGAEKYSRDNWKKVEAIRYKDAIFRHLVSYIGGEKLDPDSGNLHLAAVICSALFLIYKDKEEEKEAIELRFKSKAVKDHERLRKLEALR